MTIIIATFSSVHLLLSLSLSLLNLLTPSITTTQKTKSLVSNNSFCLLSTVIMRSTARHGVLVAAVLLLVVALSVPACAQSMAGATTTVYYGYLKIPPQYYSHPDSTDPMNQVQPGSVLLTDGTNSIRAPVQEDGSFVVYNLPYGTYLLHAEFNDFIFPTIRVDVQYKERDGGLRIPVIRTYQNDYPVRPVEGNGIDVDSPAVIPVAGRHEYYIPRENFRLIDVLKSPMIILMLVSFGMLGLLKLFPEEEMKESRKMTKEWQKKMTNMAAAAKDPTKREIKSK